MGGPATPSRLGARAGFITTALFEGTPAAGGVGVALGDGTIGEASDARTADETGFGVPTAPEGLGACVRIDRAAGADTRGARDPVVVRPTGTASPAPLPPSVSAAASGTAPSVSDCTVERPGVEDWSDGNGAPRHANRAVKPIPTTTTATAAP